MLSACQQILVVSLTVNFCCLTFFLSRRCLRSLAGSTFGQKGYFVRRVCVLNDDDRAPISRLISFHSVSCALLIFGVYLATATSVMQHPFVTTVTVNSVTTNTINSVTTDMMGLISQISSSYVDLINVAFAITIGKYVYKLCLDCILVEHVFFKLETVHHVVTIACYVIFILFRENLAMGVAGLLMDGSPVLVECTKIMKTSNVETDSSAYISLLSASCVMTSLLSLVVPGIVLIAAVATSSPFSMHYVPLSAFFLSITFFTILNIWTLKSGIVSLRKAVIARKMRNCERALRPVLKPKVPLEGSIVGSVSLDSASVPGTSIPFLKNDFHYSRAYSNVNVNCSESSALPQRNLSTQKQVNKMNVSLLLQYSVNNHQQRQSTCLPTCNDSRSCTCISARDPAVQISYGGERTDVNANTETYLQGSTPNESPVGVSTV